MVFAKVRIDLLALTHILKSIFLHRQERILLQLSVILMRVIG